MNVVAGNEWRSKLSQWGIPQEILDQAPENPWIHPPVMFQIPGEISDSPSHSKAREALPFHGSVLDIGCGGGIAAFAITPPAGEVIGVDHQPEMLEMFEVNAIDRSVKSSTYLGFWPSISPQVPITDLVVAHHVVYNVQEIEDFLLAADAHARRRVVLELPQEHPLTNSNAAWKYFWNIDRPNEPTFRDLEKVLIAIGIEPHIELWEGSMRKEIDIAQQAHFTRIRLCLPANREPEVLEFLKEQPLVTDRKLATVWWDKE